MRLNLFPIIMAVVVGCIYESSKIGAITYLGLIILGAIASVLDRK